VELAPVSPSEAAPACEPASLLELPSLLSLPSPEEAER
jgi:hypothetical protein